MGVHVAFDIGNVLCHFDIFKFTRKLSEITGINDHDAYFFLDFLQKMQDIGATTVSHHLEYKFRLSPSDLDELIETWNSTVIPNEMMLNFLDNLRGEDVKIALLSNMGFEHITHLRTTCPRLVESTVQHISCEVGARKPSKLFFQSFCLDNDEFFVTEQGKERPDFSGCVYVDDIEENLHAGKKYGFKVYQLVLEDLIKLPLSKQKIELDKLKNMIFNKI